MEGRKLKRENLQAVYGLMELGGGNCRKQILEDTAAALVLCTYLYS